MSPKTLALLVVGALMIPTVFAALPMTYPSTNPVPVDHVFENQKVSSGLSQLEGIASSTGFSNSGLNLSSPSSLLGSIPAFLLHLLQDLWDDIRGLTSGVQSTGFSSTSGSSVTIQGYVTNASGHGSPIANSMLTVSETEYYTQLNTNPTGYYSYVMVHQGKGDLSYFIQGFDPKIVTVDTIGLSSAWVNVTLTPAEKYNVSGLTEFKNDTIVKNVSINFSSKFGSYTSQSSQAGKYSLALVNGTYGITINKRGMDPIPNPYYIIVSGQSRSNYNLIINVSGKDQFNVSGFIFNKENKTISGATVGLYGSTSGNTSSNSSGFYRLRVPYGIDIITAVDAAYGYNYTEVSVSTNLTDVNITLTNKDPMSTGSTMGQQNGTNVSKNVSGNITRYLKGNNSRINYSNSTLNLTLQGNITNSLDGNPLANTSVIFYTDINGTVFLDNITTNSTGHYLIGLSYTGNYSFAVNSTFYYPKFFSLNITGNTSYNFTMVPLQSHIFNVSGYVKIYGPETPLKGSNVSLFSSLDKLVEFNISNSKGYYNIQAISGNYLINAKAFGFNTSKTIHVSLDHNITDLNFSLNISSNIGSGIVNVPPGSPSGIPGESGSSISNQLNGSSASSNATGSGPEKLTVHLVNSTSVLSNTQYVVYMEIDYVQFRYNGTTNSSGNITYYINITGRFTILANTLYNRGNSTVVNVYNNTSVTLMLSPIPVYTNEIVLHNSYNVTYANDSVPENYLNQTSSYIFHITYNSSSQTGINRTYYYRLPAGNYSFVYSDSYFVQKNFWSNITTGNVNSQEYLQPYLIITHANSSAEWYYNINSIKYVEMPSNNILNNITRETAGSHSLFVGLILNNSKTRIYQDNVLLTSQKSIFSLYLNMSKEIDKFQSSSFTENKTDGKYWTFTVKGNTSSLSNSDYIYGLNTSLDLINANVENISLSVSGQNVQTAPISTGFNSTDFFGLVSYLHTTTSFQTFNVFYNLNDFAGFTNSGPPVFFIYYVHASEHGAYS